MALNEIQLEQLKELYPHNTRKEIAEILGVTTPSISAYCVKMGLNYKNAKRVNWTMKKIRELKELYSNPAVTNQEIAEQFGVSVNSIHSAARRYNIKRGTWREEGLKVCSCCGGLKPATKEYFHVRNKNQAHILHSWCKECHSEYTRTNRVQKQKRLSIDQKQRINFMYGNIKAEDIAKELGVKTHQVEYYIKAMQKKGKFQKIKPRKVV